MGLDQYAMAVMPHKENTDLSIGWTREDGDGKVTEIAYWRKHANLQGWMENLYVRKCEANGISPNCDERWGGVVFNCQPLRLTFQDLADLEQAVTGNDLPHTTGFFFGESHPETRKDDLAFIEKARQAIGMDMEVYYDSWW